MMEGSLEPESTFRNLLHFCLGEGWKGGLLSSFCAESLRESLSPIQRPLYILTSPTHHLLGPLKLHVFGGHASLFLSLFP